MPESPELHGWKQIAGYLRVSIRTAQAMEKDQGLPVHRGPGTKSPVYAFAAEIDRWYALKSRPPERPERPDQLPSRRRWLRYGVIAGASALTLGGFELAFRRLRWMWAGVPGSCQVQGHVLIVYDRTNAELWRYTFPEIMSRPPTPCVFADLSGHGRRETLFIAVPLRLHATACMVCFGADGSRRWTFYPGKTVIDNRGRQFSPPYSVLQVVAFRTGASKADRIVVASVHNYSFPAQLAILDPAGKVVAEYWHRGHLTHIAVADLDGDGEPEILAGGVNDAPEIGQATLLVFDHRHLAGATPDAHGGSYFQGIPPFPAKHTVFFPKSPISQGLEFNRVREVVIQADRILVEVVEGTAEDGHEAVDYELNFRLEILNVTPDDAFLNRLRELQRQGQIPDEPAYLVVELLKRGVRVL
ncbi:MAG: hypothetical protein JST11_19500 [Acidobacteria bacterium]|nr:hypothetical protein [Acidobacteriota bacterium]